MSTVVRRLMLGLALAAPLGACARAQESPRTAEVAQAEAALRRGDRAAAAQRALAITAAYEAGGARWSSADRVAAGRAYLLLGAGNAAAVRQALAAFDDAARADPQAAAASTAGSPE